MKLKKRKLIEVALPLEAINVASAHEKSIRHGHPSTMHPWWARRPLAACRAVLFASLVDDPSSDPDRFPTPETVETERTRLFAIIERLVQWENSTNSAVLEEARAEIRRSTNGNLPSVFDPFCGGGSIPLEAQRLGLTAYASDLNPVAVLITKALIEIPPMFVGGPPVHPDARGGIGASGAWSGATGLAEDVRRYGTWIRDEAERRIGHLYPKVRLPAEYGGGQATPIAWLWTRTVKCPNPACGASMPLVRSFAISTRKGNEAWIEPIVNRALKTVTFEMRIGRGTVPEPPKVGRGANFRCLICGQVSPEEHIKSEGREGRMGIRLLAVVAEGPKGRVFLGPSSELERAAASASPTWAPDGDLATHPQYMGTPQYGLTRFQDLFTARQLVALTTFSDLVGEVHKRVLRDASSAGAFGQVSPGPAAYADAVVTYLGLASSKMAAFHCVLSRWRPAEGKSAPAFGRQAIPMVWDFAEVGPFSGAGGDWQGVVNGTAGALDRLRPDAPGFAVQTDAVSASGIEGALISTDPPYYDNVPYADLSDFFYVWLRRTLGNVYPALFSTVLVPKSQELVADVFRHGGRDSARDFFERGLGQTFERLRTSGGDEPMTVYYAFKQAESDDERDDGELTVVSTGWETMLEGLLRAGFRVVGTWPGRTEGATRLRAMSSNVLASSIVLVCRPRTTDTGITTRKDFVATLKRELPEALRTLQHGNIAPVDLAQSSIGPGMAVFSRYAKVLEPDGSAMRVRDALALINQILDEILAEQEGEFDADTRWAIAWYEQFGLGEAEYGTAETLSKAKNTSVAGLVDAGIVAASRGRVRLHKRDEYRRDWDPAKDNRIAVWETTQRLVHILLTDGESAAGLLLARLGGLGDAARGLAYRLYQVADRKGWAEEARAYNALVVSWPDLLHAAEQAGKTAQASLGLET